MSTILITGGTGLIGRALTGELLSKGHQLIILSREKRGSGNPALEYACWDPEQGRID
ncbi:MAG: NAD-dependent epimerase/dehydratase family protein, partial [Chitinophagaceae bacterium]